MLEHAITRVIIGQTMTSFDGASRAQGEVHQDVLASIVKADDDLLSDSFNAGPARWLTEWNFPGAKPPKIRRRVEPPDDLKEAAEIDTKVYAMGFEPSEEYIRGRYGPGWSKKQAPEQVPPPGLAAPEPEPKDEPPPPASFAELLDGDEDSIADLAAALAASDDPLPELLYANVLQFLEEQPDLATARERLAGLLPRLPADIIARRIGSASFQARMAGLLGLPLSDAEAEGA